MLNEWQLKVLKSVEKIDEASYNPQRHLGRTKSDWFPQLHTRSEWKTISNHIVRTIKDVEGIKKVSLDMLQDGDGIGLHEYMIIMVQPPKGRSYDITIYPYYENYKFQIDLREVPGFKTIEKNFKDYKDVAKRMEQVAKALVHHA